MNFNSDFKYDLKLGNKGENLLYNIIKLKGQTIEVKTDRDAIKNKCTGNLFIEYMSRGKLSGISTTQAKWWAFVISNEQIILIETNKLKKLCKLKTLKRVSGGDNNTSKGILLPLKYLTT
jgi:hypothetical protein|tara:strand:+ start:740 stop:1099 length:360 start_codon:yes stop_codon:yes gene_type:complete